jgi:hypothetical protein
LQRKRREGPLELAAGPSGALKYMLDPETIERVTRGAHDSAVRLQVRSALNPLLWLCAICTPLTFGLAIFASGFMQAALLVLGGTPILCACGAYIYWMLRSPDRLHSEDYQLRRQALQMIYEKGGRTAVLASSVVAITNPNLPKLPEDSK